MEVFRLTVLGTASAMPVRDRFQSAHVLSVHGRLSLIDCGEGVQRQLMRYGISLLKIDSIYISHTHGDHLFGLFGLLSTIGMLGRQAPLHIYGPADLGPILDFHISSQGKWLGYPISFHSLRMKSPEVIFETKAMEVLSFPLRHGVPTYGYLFREKMPQMNVRKDKLAEYGFSLTEIGALKSGGDVVREDAVIPNSEAAYLPFVPRSYAYCSDTAPFPELAGWVRGVDLLYHEATYVDALSDQASVRHHSTTLQAAQCARDAGVGRLIIGHYSSRVQDISLYETECRSIFPETYAANDGDVFDVEMKRP